MPIIHGVTGQFGTSDVFDIFLDDASLRLKAPMLTVGLKDITGASVAAAENVAWWAEF